VPALSNRILLGKLLAALPRGTGVTSPRDFVHPVLVDVPTLGPWRVYLFTATPDRSRAGARPPGEFKIQLILPDQERGRRAGLDLIGRSTALLGYSPDFGVFVGWEPALYQDFAYSANVQVRDDLLAEARDLGWAVSAPRRRGTEQEVRAAFTPGNLERFLDASSQADRRGLHGVQREAYFLSRTPGATELPRRRAARSLETYVERERMRVRADRLSRDRRFGPAVKREFNYSCAVCRMQLEIIEAAHIIPVLEPRSTDHVTNGVALCPNHHRLFDARSFAIACDLHIRVDHDTIEFLRQSKRATGIESLTTFEGQRILAPRYWRAEPERRDAMVAALELRSTLSAL